jgi:hypothetical protein
MTLRILTQLNFSAGENPEGDSGLRFTARLLKELHRADRRLHFYVLIPEQLDAACRAHLPKSRITLIPLEIPPRTHGGDFAFHPAQLYSRFDFRKYDIDVLFLNQPETAVALLNFLNRQTFHLLPAVSYVHWFDTRRPSTPKQTSHFPAILGALSGMAVSTFVGCNSVHGRDGILEQATRWLSTRAVADLREKIRVLPPPVSAQEIARKKPLRRAAWHRKGPKRPASLLVNHRILKYTGVRQLIEHSLPRLWRVRKDFKVLVTNPTRVRIPGSLLRVPWVEHRTLAPQDYARRLWDSDIVLAPHRATHWSISTLEAVCAECLPVCNQEGFFPEMFAPVLQRMPQGSQSRFEKYCLYYRGNLQDKIGQALDELPVLGTFRTDLARATRATYDWKVWTRSWLKLFYDAYATVPSMSPSNPSMKRIMDLIRQRGALSKRDLLNELHWAPKTRTVAWTSFRKVLRTMSRDDAALSELVFEALPPAAKR